MIKLSMAQKYLIGFIQRGEYKLYVNRPARVAALKSESGVLTNPIYITLAQADGIIKRNAVLEEMPESKEKVTTYVDNPDFERIPKVFKVKTKGGIYYGVKAEKND